MIKQIKQKLINYKEARKNNDYYQEGHADGRKEKIEEYEKQILDLKNEMNLLEQDYQFTIARQKDEIKRHEAEDKRYYHDRLQLKQDQMKAIAIIEKVKPAVKEFVLSNTMIYNTLDKCSTELKKIK